jgi:hypothetical protein
MTWTAAIRLQMPVGNWQEKMIGKNGGILLNKVENDERRSWEVLREKKGHFTALFVNVNNLGTRVNMLSS